MKSSCDVARCQHPAEHPWRLLCDGQYVVTLKVCAGHHQARLKAPPAPSPMGFTYEAAT